MPSAKMSQSRFFSFALNKLCAWIMVHLPQSTPRSRIDLLTVGHLPCLPFTIMRDILFYWILTFPRLLDQICTLGHRAWPPRLELIFVWQYLEIYQEKLKQYLSTISLYNIRALTIFRSSHPSLNSTLDRQVVCWHQHTDAAKEHSCPTMCSFN